MPEITMPKLSDTMTEGTLVSWKKKKGDQVSTGEVIAEIETDKATMEWESPEDGTLTEIYVEEGGKVNVGDKIAFIVGEGEETPSEKKEEEPEKKEEKPKKAEAKEEKKGEAKKEKTSQTETEKPVSAEEAEEETAPPQESEKRAKLAEPKKPAEKSKAAAPKVDTSE
jgi:pyruvate/2-oxoglutarate dehydrogenase complex dihydrolipoamide acyltransferase (E2) component